MYVIVSGTSNTSNSAKLFDAQPFTGCTSGVTSGDTVNLSLICDYKNYLEPDVDKINELWLSALSVLIDDITITRNSAGYEPYSAFTGTTGQTYVSETIPLIKYITYTDENGIEVKATVDLTSLENKSVDYSLYKAGSNEFSFSLPKSGNAVTFKLLTHGDDKKIEAEVKGLQKINPMVSPEMTTRLKYMITSINGQRDQKDIRDFVDNAFLAPDARALREYYNSVSPDINLKYYPNGNYTGEGIAIPISLNFFWPDSIV